MKIVRKSSADRKLNTYEYVIQCQLCLKKTTLTLREKDEIQIFSKKCECEPVKIEPLTPKVIIPPKIIVKPLIIQPKKFVHPPIHHVKGKK